MSMMVRIASLLAALLAVGSPATPVATV